MRRYISMQVEALVPDTYSEQQLLKALRFV